MRCPRTVQAGPVVVPVGGVRQTPRDERVLLLVVRRARAPRRARAHAARRARARAPVLLVLVPVLEDLVFTIYKTVLHYIVSYF